MFKITDKKYYILIAILVILALFLLYFIQTSKRYNLPGAAEVNKLLNQSSSTDLDSVEKDLDETDFSELDKELEDIEKELDVL